MAVVSISNPATPIPRVHLAHGDDGEARVLLVSSGLSILTPVEAAHLGRQLLDTAREILVDGVDDSGTPNTIPTPGIDAHLVEHPDGRLTSAGHPRVAAVRAWRRPGGDGVEAVEWTLEGEPGPAGCEPVGGVVRGMIWRRRENE